MSKLYHYKWLPDDIEQLEQREFEQWFFTLLDALNSLPEKSQDAYSKDLGSTFFNILSGKNKIKEVPFCMRLWTVEENIYLETNSPLELLPGIELQAEENLFENIFGDRKFYSDAKIEDDYLIVNGQYWQLINFYEFPRHLSLSNLMNLGDYHLNLKKMPFSAAKKVLELTRKVHHANEANLNGLEDIDSSAKKGRIEGVLADLYDGEALFEVEGWFVVKSTSRRALREQTKIIMDLFSKGQGEPLLETTALSTLFPKIFPGANPLFKRGHPTPTSYLIGLLPLLRDSLHRNGAQFYSRRGTTLYFDLFDAESLNANALICGPSGSGKSVLAQKLVLENLKSNKKIVIFDLGESFKKMALYYNGKIFSEKFNPYSFKDPLYLKELILSVIPVKERSFKKEAQIFQQVKIALNKNFTKFKDFLNFIDSAVGDITIYFEEYFDYFTDDNLPDNPITYVDTTLFHKKLLSPLLLYLIEYFKRLEGEKVFLFDECWNLFHGHENYLETSFRTFRKHGASAVAISQTFQDFSETKIGKIILNCSYHKFFFGQDIEQNNFISEWDQSNIKSLKTVMGEYSEFYLKTEKNRKVLRYYQEPFEYELFTSNKRDKDQFEKFCIEQSKYFDFQECLNRWVEYKYEIS